MYSFNLFLNHILAYWVSRPNECQILARMRINALLCGPLPDPKTRSLDLRVSCQYVVFRMPFHFHSHPAHGKDGFLQNRSLPSLQNEFEYGPY